MKRAIFWYLDQCLDLSKGPQDNSELRGQIIISLLSRDGLCSNTPLAVVGPLGDLHSPQMRFATTENISTDLDDQQYELPAGWAERKTDSGHIYYVNHKLRTSQWKRPVMLKDENQKNGSLVLNDNNDERTDDHHVDENCPGDSSCASTSGSGSSGVTTPGSKRVAISNILVRDIQTVKNRVNFLGFFF